MKTSLQDTMRMRALKAIAVVMALLLMVPGIEALVHAAGGSAAYGSVSGTINALSIVQAGDPFESLERIEGLVSAEGADVPDGFSREVGFPAGAHDVRVDATGTVVGYSIAGDASAAIESLTEHMQAHGWKAVPLGGVDGATFVKSGGVYSWVLATSTRVENSASVVMRCMRS